MRIESVKIKNYHSIVECEFDFSNLFALVGENNSGKSNIIYALNLFFSKDKPSNIYSFNDPSKPIEITIKFKDLTDYEKGKITEDHRDGDEFILKKIYKYNPSENNIEKDFTSIKDGKDTNIKPRGFENVLSDTLPEFYLLRAVKYCSEEIKMAKTTNFNKFLSLVLKDFETEFQTWDEILEELNKETQKSDEEAPLVKIAKEIGIILKEQFYEADVSLRPKDINRLDVLNTLEVFIDDDSDLPLLTKGQGTQRAFIFAVLRVLAEKINKERPTLEKEKKDIIIAIEEPELFLHPHQQKIVYSILKELSEQTKEQIQIVYSTHSSFMVHVEDYQFIGIVRKPSVIIGTKIFQHTQEIFPSESKKEFQLLCQFDPERNELFFAKKVVFVEGDTEKFSLPIILDKLGINPINKGISIIECGCKDGIKLFLQIANKFNQSERVINYLVIHDKDIPWKDQSDEKKEEKEKQTEEENEEIANLCGSNPIFVFEPDFERELKLDSGDDGKPYKAKKAINGMEAKDFPERLKNFLTQNL